ncbi:N-acetyltransferase [Ferruginivarius sediminum]|uniref:N-acetyltransferase n=1 Tax=Ferruginivarius sediminum TaxID=2661937 RepID=A0A369T459_9PROT|nr:N-acetyltransferase [Ferruginivarius sediminum]
MGTGEPDIEIQPGAIVGLKAKEEAGPVVIRGRTRIRSGSVIYADVDLGKDFQTGHNVTIRGHTTIGAHVVVGTNTVLEGYVEIADFVKIESNCFIPTHVKIGTRVFIGPGVTLTNDRYPLKNRDEYEPEGPVLEDGVTLAAGVVVMPGVRIGRGSFVAAGAIVTKDVPEMSLVRGLPSRIYALPEHLREFNIALSWRGFLKNSSDQ